MSTLAPPATSRERSSPDDATGAAMQTLDPVSWIVVKRDVRPDGHRVLYLFERREA